MACRDVNDFYFDGESTKNESLKDVSRVWSLTQADDHVHETLLESGTPKEKQSEGHLSTRRNFSRDVPPRAAEMLQVLKQKDQSKTPSPPKTITPSAVQNTKNGRTCSLAFPPEVYQTPTTPKEALNQLQAFLQLFPENERDASWFTAMRSLSILKSAAATIPYLAPATPPPPPPPTENLQFVSYKRPASHMRSTRATGQARQQHTGVLSVTKAQTNANISCLPPTQPTSSWFIWGCPRLKRISMWWWACCCGFSSHKTS